MSGIILEGIAGTGKTSALTALLASQAWLKKPFFSSVVLTEHHTLRVLESAVYDPTHSIALLNTHISYLEHLHTQLTQTDWLARERSAQKVPFIMERFHFSHLYHYKGLSWHDVQDIDKRLHKLHTTLYLFTIDPADIPERIINDYRKAGWDSYLHTLGPTTQAVQEYFVAKQEMLLKLAERTCLPIVHIDSSSMDTEAIVEQVLSSWDILKQ